MMLSAEPDRCREGTGTLVTLSVAIRKVSFAQPENGALFFVVPWSLFVLCCLIYVFEWALSVKLHISAFALPQPVISKEVNMGVSYVAQANTGHVILTQVSWSPC